MTDLELMVMVLAEKIGGVTYRVVTDMVYMMEVDQCVLHESDLVWVCPSGIEVSCMARGFTSFSWEEMDEAVIAAKHSLGIMRSSNEEILGSL